MSVQRYNAADGTRWRVRWREGGGKMRSRTFLTRRDAQGFDAEIKARRFRGDALPRSGRTTLGEAWTDWLRLIGPQKAESTRRNYLALWAAHVQGRFDHHRLSALTVDPQLIDEFVADMAARGVGRASQRKTLMVISAVLTQCVHWNWISSNPMWSRRARVTAPTSRAARPFPPIVIERLRNGLSHRATRDAGDPRGLGDATLVSLLAYAGLRPQEALALKWDDVGRQVISIDKAVSFGKLKGTKTGKSRFVPLAEPLARDLMDWRQVCASPPNWSLLFPSSTGDLWSNTAWNNWRGRVWKPVARDLAETDEALAHLTGSRPYDCRGSFISLHLRAGASPLEVAQWSGHSPQVMFTHYASVIEELVGEPRVSAARQIKLARDALVTRAPSDVRELTAEGMKPPGEVSPSAYQLLYGARSARRSDPSLD